MCPSGGHIGINHNLEKNMRKLTALVALASVLSVTAVMATPGKGKAYGHHGDDDTSTECTNTTTYVSSGDDIEFASFIGDGAFVPFDPATDVIWLTARRDTIAQVCYRADGEGKCRQIEGQGRLVGIPVRLYDADNLTAVETVGATSVTFEIR